MRYLESAVVTTRRIVIAIELSCRPARAGSARMRNAKREHECAPHGSNSMNRAGGSLSPRQSLVPPARLELVLNDPKMRGEAGLVKSHLGDELLRVFAPHERLYRIAQGKRG